MHYWYCSLSDSSLFFLLEIVSNHHTVLNKLEMQFKNHMVKGWGPKFSWHQSTLFAVSVCPCSGCVITKGLTKFSLSILQQTLSSQYLWRGAPGKHLSVRDTTHGTKNILVFTYDDWTCFRNRHTIYCPKPFPPLYGTLAQFHQSYSCYIWLCNPSAGSIRIV